MARNARGGGAPAPPGIARAGAPGPFLIAAGLSLGPTVTLGFARFAYALLLPAMRDDLHWSFVTAGAMNAVNATGYLGGALAAVPVSRAAGARRSFVGGMIVTALTLGASALTAETSALLLLRLVAGAAGGVTFIVGAGMVAHLGSEQSAQRAARLLGVYFAGGGLGILLSAVFVPAILARTSPGAGWRLGWALLAAIAAVSVLAAAVAARRTRLPAAFSGRDGWPAARLLPLVVAYGLYGCGYIAYMTFIVAFLGANGVGHGAVSLFWSVLGAAAIAGGFGWGLALGRLPGGRGASLLLGLVAAGALLPLVSASLPVALLSAMLFGASFLSVVTAVTTAVRRLLAPRHWTSAIAGLTIVFAAGQCAGPLLAGALSDRPGGLRGGLMLSVGVLAAAAVIALVQPDVEPGR